MHRLLPLFLALSLAGLAAPAAASPRDHDRARAALQAGEVLPLARVLEAVGRSHPGDVLEVELERDHGRWIYELTVLQRDGALLKLEVDARTAEVLKRKEARR